MPEMPEVETIVRKLRRSIVGLTVVSVELSGLPLRKPVLPTFAGRLTTRRIRGVRRRGKYIILELEPRAFCVVHLGMSGRLFHLPGVAPKPEHTHALFRLSDGSQLQYRDHRRFGLLELHEVARIGLIPEVGALGPEPLAPHFSGVLLSKGLKGCRQEIKSFLLDQGRIAGLGNIYVCEALFHAGIRPTRRCFTIADDEAGRLAEAIRKVLRKAIRHRGTSFSDFMDSDGKPGENQRFLRVFQREGERCRRCRRPIERIVQGNRSSFYCPRCQR
jgi:formamidopyrimidine-DNA glycosylase